MQQENNISRTGPRPLWLHLQNAMLVAAQHQDTSFFQKYLEGVQNYFHHRSTGYNRSERYDVIWQKDDVRVLAPKGHALKKGQLACLLVPSLINDHTVFDLSEHASFFSYLNGNDICPLMIDWGSPYSMSKQSIDDYVTGYLVSMLETLSKETDRLSVTGYCMGGLLLMAACNHMSSIDFNLMYMATPWDFDRMHEDSKQAARSIWALNQYSEHFLSHVPVDMVQSFFAMIDTSNTVSKFVQFNSLDMPQKKDLFVAVEDWLNHGKPVSFNVFKSCIHDWYLHNQPAKGLWECGGKRIDVPVTDRPVLFIVPQKDKLVAPESAKALFQRYQNADLIEPDTGHIGLMGSMNAKEKVWQPIVDWLKAIETKHI